VIQDWLESNNKTLQEGEDLKISLDQQEKIQGLLLRCLNYREEMV